MCNEITSNILSLRINLFNTGTAPSLVRTSIFPIEFCNCNRPIHNMSLKSASNTAGNVVGQVMLLLKQYHLHVPEHFGEVDNYTVLLLVGTSFGVRLIKGIFSFEQA